MIRAKAMQMIVTLAHKQGLDRALFYNMQAHGLIKAYPLDISPAMTSAMGLGGGQTPVLMIEL